MRIVVIYDVIVLRLRLLFSRILIDYEKNENKTPSKIYTITVLKKEEKRKLFFHRGDGVAHYYFNTKSTGLLYGRMVWSSRSRAKTVQSSRGCPRAVQSSSRGCVRAIQSSWDCAWSSRDYEDPERGSERTHPPQVHNAEVSSELSNSSLEICLRERQTFIMHASNLSEANQSAAIRARAKVANKRSSCHGSSLLGLLLCIRACSKS